MLDNSEDSLEFYSVETDDELVAFSRSAFRVNVADEKGFYLYIRGVPLKIISICADGVSVRGFKQGTAPLEDYLDDCVLHMVDMRFPDLIGKVVHRSVDEDGMELCGIQWLTMSPLLTERFETLVHALRRRMFSVH